MSKAGAADRPWLTFSHPPHQAPHASMPSGWKGRCLRSEVEVFHVDSTFFLISPLEKIGVLQGHQERFGGKGGGVGGSRPHLQARNMGLERLHTGFLACPSTERQSVKQVCIKGGGSPVGKHNARMMGFKEGARRLEIRDQ